MKQHHTKYKPIYEAYILSHITEDFDGNSLTTDAQRIAFLFKRFRSEYGWRIEQAGKRQAMTDWLQGLAIPFACYNGDIIDLAIRFGSIDPDPSPKQIYRVLENYWSFMANIILGMEGRANV